MEEQMNTAAVAEIFGLEPTANSASRKLERDVVETVAALNLGGLRVQQLAETVRGLSAQRDGLIKHREAIREQRDAALAQRDMLVVALEKILNMASGNCEDEEAHAGIEYVADNALGLVERTDSPTDAELMAWLEKHTADQFTCFPRAAASQRWFDNSTDGGRSYPTLRAAIVAAMAAERRA